MTDPSTYDVEAAAQRVLSAIVADMEAGKIPPTVGDFSELYGHADGFRYLTEAGGVPYGFDIPERDDDPHGNRLLNAVEDRASALLAERVRDTDTTRD